MSIPPSRRDGFADEYPFASHFLEVDGHRYHYVDKAPQDGPPRGTLLMVHGNPTWSFAWRNLIKALATEYRVLAVDHIGCGFSDKPQQYDYSLNRHIENLREFIDRLDLHDITLFAHDWGGAIGMGTAVRSPERFSRFVLMNTAAFRSQHMPLRISLCQTPLFGRLAVRGANLFCRAALHMAVERPLPAPVKAGLLAPYDNWSHRIAIQRFVEDIPLRRTHPSYETLVAIEEGLEQFTDRPMLLIWGERDWCFTPAFRQEFERRFPQAVSHPIADAGHYVFEDAADIVIQKSREFLHGSSP